MDRPSMLLVEYSEAGHNCRAQEQYVRATLSMYLALSAALAAFMATSAVPIVGRMWLSFGGAAVGFCMTLLVWRHRAVYAAYVQRARAIEAELKLALYTQGTQDRRSAGELTAKTLSAFIIGGIAISFLVAAVCFARGG